MSNMNRKSLDPRGEHVSPLGDGKIDRQFSGIEVMLLHWPDETNFKEMVYKASTATRGNKLEEKKWDPKVVDDAFKGGLNQCLEWETVVFEISGVSRGLTHELVRTRKASFAQQSMRHTNMGIPAMRLPAEIANNPEAKRIWVKAIETSQIAYRGLVELDIPFQDARTVLPIATETYVIASYPLGEFLNTYAYRACEMFYPEMVYLFRVMKDTLLTECSWLRPYVLISCEKTGPKGPHLHQCTYQGWERVEGHCTFPWAKEENRVWKSTRFES